MAASALGGAPQGRRAASRETRREAILDVASASFLSQGYAATTMSGIAASLGGSKGTLWSYYRSKDLLFAAVLDRATQSLRDELVGLLDPDAPLQPTLERATQRQLAQATSRKSVALYRVILAEAHRFPEVARIFDERVVVRSVTLMASYLGAAMAGGRLRPANPQLAARQLRALLMCGCHHRLMLGMAHTATQAEIETDAKSAVLTFLAANSIS